MKKGKIKTILTYSIIAVFICIVAILLVSRGNTTLYSDETTIGNTSCNLLNGGLFAEDEDVIYFANPYDHNKLYKMSTDLTHVKKISDDNVSYLNVAGKYIFYTRRNDKLENDGNALISLSTTGLFRTTKNGGAQTKIYDDPTQVVKLYGNYLYYQHYDQKEGLSLYAAKIDASSDEQLLDEAAAPYAIAEDTIYYTGWDSDHCIHSLPISGGSPQIVYNGNCTSLTQNGNYLYFMDMDNNYALCRIGLDGSNPEVIVNNRLATYNISADGSKIYYQLDNGEANGLYVLDAYNNNTSNIAMGNFNFLSLVSHYLFYETYDGTTAFVYDISNGKNQIFKPETN